MSFVNQIPKNTVHDLILPLTSPTATGQDVADAVRDIVNLGNTITAQLQKADPAPADYEEVNQLEGLSYMVAASLFSIVKETPLERQANLVAFVRLLRTQTVNPLPPADAVYPQIWTDLPHFGSSARDSYNYDVNEPRDDLRRIQVRNATNLIFFLATLTALADPDGNFNFALYGLWSLRAALEEKRKSEEEIRLAALWIIIAGDVLKEGCKLGVRFPERCGIAGRKYRCKHKDWRGFSPERALVWKKGFEKAQEWVKRNDTKGMIDMALKVLNEE